MLPVALCPPGRPVSVSSLVPGGQATNAVPITKQAPLRAGPLVMSLVVLAMLTFPTAAPAAFPGDNGKIAFMSGFNPDWEIFVINPDGSGAVALTNNSAHDGEPAWDPSGTRIAFISNRNGLPDIFEMNGDGTGVTQITNSAATERYPAWSPDGKYIVYQSLQGNVNQIRVMNADGTGDSLLTTGQEPAWSPDGTKIAFADRAADPGGEGGREIHTIRPDGTDRQQLITFVPQPCPSPGFHSEFPNWTPNGQKILFGLERETTCDPPDVFSEIVLHTMNPDGTGRSEVAPAGDGRSAWSPDGTKIVNSGLSVMSADGTGRTDLYFGFEPDWQPLPRGYVRPRGATPTRVPLVPAAKQCTSPNSTHGAPLSFSSCSPPQTETSATFLGIGDGDPAPARSIGSVLLRVLDGSATPGDDSDVSFRVQITNVMRPDRSEYPGELRLELPLRITDRFNKPHPGGSGPGTVADTSIFATVPCATTADPVTGSTCALTTSADALAPATVREGARSVWGLGQIRLHDGGADEDADTPGDNQLVAVQGVFAP
jgi:WD40 repeat protein